MLNGRKGNPGILIDDVSILKKIGWGDLTKSECDTGYSEFRKRILNRFPDEPAKPIFEISNWLNLPVIRNDLGVKTLREQFELFLPEDLPEDISEQIALYIFHVYKGFKPKITDFSYELFVKYIRAGLSHYYDFMWFDYFLGRLGYTISDILKMMHNKSQVLWNDTASIRNYPESRLIPNWYIQFENYVSTVGIGNSSQDIIEAIDKLYKHPLEIPPKFSMLSRLLNIKYQKAKEIWNYLFLFGLTMHLYYDPADFGLAGQFYRGRIMKIPFLAFEDYLRSVPVKNVIHVLYTPVKYAQKIAVYRSVIRLHRLNIYQNTEIYLDAIQNKIKFENFSSELFEYIETNSDKYPAPKLTFNFAINEHKPKFNLTKDELKVLDLLSFGVKFSFGFDVLSQISGIRINEIKAIAKDLLDKGIVRPYLHLHNMGLGEKILLELYGDPKIVLEIIKFLTKKIPMIAHYETAKDKYSIITMRLPQFSGTSVIEALRKISEKYDINIFTNYVVGGRSYIMTLLSRNISNGDFVEYDIDSL